jgi:hypothetical protein
MWLGIFILFTVIIYTSGRTMGVKFHVSWFHSSARSFRVWIHISDKPHCATACPDIPLYVQACSGSFHRICLFQLVAYWTLSVYSENGQDYDGSICDLMWTSIAEFCCRYWGIPRENRMKQSSACCLLHSGLLLAFNFDLDNGGRSLLRNVFWFSPDFIPFYSWR